MMNQEPVDQFPTAQKSKKSTKVLLGVLVVLLIAAIGYGIYAWSQNSKLVSDLNNERSKAQALSTENAQLKKDSSGTPTVDTITDTLPNGKTVTYPNTEGNRNILWWDAGNGASNELVVVSHKSYQEYMSSLDSDLVVKVCGTHNNLKGQQSDIIYGLLNTDIKKVTHPQNPNCIEVLASEENTDQASRDSATKLLTSIKSDIDEFVKSATIK